MRLSFQRTPEPGETRACLDPWRFAIVRADGDVSLCCRSPAVGNLRGGSLESILEGEPARRLRHALLTGELPDYCRDCCERGVTTRAELQRAVEEHLAEDDLDVIERLRAENQALVEVRGDLSRERDALRGHATNLESERAHLVGHIQNLESERPHLLGHIQNLEAELARLRERLRALGPDQT